MATPDETALDLAKTEYVALQEEILKRIGGQGTAFAATVALVGAFIGVLIQFQVDVDNSNVSMLTALLRGSDKELVQAEITIQFIVLIGGFALGVEMLLSYWAYQLIMMFRISHYLGQLIDDIRQKYNLPADVRIFEWTSKTPRTRAMWNDASPLASLGIKAGLFLQPLMLFALICISLVMMGIGLWRCYVSVAVSNTARLSLTVAFAVLLIGVATILFAMVAAHEPGSQTVRVLFMRIASLPGRAKRAASWSWKEFKRAFGSGPQTPE